MNKDRDPAESSNRRAFVKKALYVTPALLTMAIVPGMPAASAQAQSKGKGKGKGKGPIAVPEPATMGLLGLGAAVAIGYGVKKRRAKETQGED